MKIIIDLLTAKEKKIIQLMLLFSILSFLFFIFTLTWPRTQLSKLETRLASQKKSLEQAKEARDKSEQQWLLWSEASHQLEELKSKWYYQAEEGLRQLRLDLEEIFSQAGIELPALQYHYQDLEKGQVRKVSFNLRLRVSYPNLRELLALLETFPRFLFLEDLDFQGVSEGGTNLDLRLIISAYYVY